MSNEIVDTTEYFQVRINKKMVKRIALTTAAVAVVVGAVLVTKNLNVETTDSSVTVELND